MSSYCWYLLRQHGGRTRAPSSYFSQRVGLSEARFIGIMIAAVSEKMHGSDRAPALKNDMPTLGRELSCHCWLDAVP